MLAVVFLTSAELDYENDLNFQTHPAPFLTSTLIAMSDLFPIVTSDEVDPDAVAEAAKRDAEIESDKPPHHDD